MKKWGFFIAEAWIITRLFLADEIMLTLCILLVQVGFLVLLSGFARSHNVQIDLSKPKKILLAVLLIFVFVPIGILYKEARDPSAWSEIGLLLRGPLWGLVGMLSINVLVVFVIGSLYLRTRNDLD